MEAYFPLGAFLLGAGAALLGVGLGVLIHQVILFRRRRRFASYLERLRGAVDKIEGPSADPANDNPMHEKTGYKEVSELSFRDKNGEMTKVRIVIDYDLADLSKPDMQTFQAMVDSGEAGTLGDLMDGHKVSEDAMGKVQEFVFSPQAVWQMRSSGLEPDEVVTKMLKASGRME